ncbi:uncharacterized protein LOC129243598 [Anastrepha obliqua]|uniref:uncharacterized protein LOC129243598 n=1 Tax=Anastrepha obliqua TaxID=95512 RepID=UPI002409F9F8|nr:uncharacterized protein LOC129243598 [Anastrepha obliqua]
MLLIYSAMLFLISPLLMAHLSINWSPANTLSINISQIINKIKSEREIYSFLIINAYGSSESCLCDDSIRLLSAYGTVRLLQANSSCSLSPSDYNDEILLIRCLPNKFVSDSLEKMVACLGRKRNIRILFIWNTEYKNELIQNREDLQKQKQLLFEYCAQMRLLNVISIYRDYVDDGHFYTFSYFPQFHVQRKPMKEDCFPDRIKDMKGVAIRSLADGFEPWNIVWRDRFGHIHITGFVSKLLREFAKRNNGTLTYPAIDNLTQVQNWLPLLKNDTIDIVTGIGSSNIKTAGVDISTTLVSTDWIIMLPLPPLVPDSGVLLFLLNSVLGLFLLLLLLIFSFVLTLEGLLWGRRSPTNSLRFFIWILTNVVLRSIIGQSSCSVVHVKAKFTKRFIYIFLLLSGIFMSTYITAGLNSYITSNPHKYSRLTTFEEFINSEIKIKESERLYRSLVFFIDPKYVRIIENKFIIEPSFELLQRQRSSLDTRFGYTVGTALWKAMSRHQSYLPRPLFYEHSIFKEALNNMIHQAKSIGLTDLWIRQIYDDMLAAKKINRTIVQPLGYEPLDLTHFYWLWWMYGFGVSLSVLAETTMQNTHGGALGSLTRKEESCKGASPKKLYNFVNRHTDILAKRSKKSSGSPRFCRILWYTQPKAEHTA